MVTLPGILYIRTIHGRNGAFSVGRLATEIGEFAIKDALLEQYDEGRYEGQFGISRIYPFSYFAQNRMVVEIRATLETLALAAIEDLPEGQDEPIQEPDPIDSEPSAAHVPEPQIPPVPTGPGEEGGYWRGTQMALGLLDGDEPLFGTLWPLGRSVKLDTTVDRALFRQQKDRLKALGYRFKSLGQSWEMDN